jgi:hypothetical protein
VDVRRLGQLKVRAANLTLKSGEAIARFYEHQKLNPQWSLLFPYVGVLLHFREN